MNNERRCNERNRLILNLNQNVSHIVNTNIQNYYFRNLYMDRF